MDLDAGKLLPAVSLSRTVEWVDTDASGHQHNSVVIRWVEAAEAQLMRELDLPQYFPHAPRVQHVVNYTGMLWFGQRADIHLCVSRVGTTSLTLEFEVIAEAIADTPGGAVANGSVTTVWFPAGAKSAQPWPEEMREQLEGTGARQR